MTKDTLILQLSAANIKRYHTLPIQGENTVGHHTYGVCQIMRYITEDDWSHELMRACLDHDVAEHFTGDLPRMVKNAHPDLANALTIVEHGINVKFGLNHDLTDEEKVILRCADLLDMGYFGIHQRDLGCSNGKLIVMNVLEGLHKMPLGGSQRYRELMVDLEEALYGRQ